MLRRLFKPTRIVFGGLNAGQMPRVSVHYGNWLVFELELPAQHIQRAQESVLYRALNAESN